MVDSNIIGLVIFSGFLGLAIWWINYESKEEAKPLYDLINAAHKAMINMALLILDYMPWLCGAPRRTRSRREVSPPSWKSENSSSRFMWRLSFSLSFRSSSL